MERWAQENDEKILAVSTDEDWIHFAEKSDYIDVEKTLESALGMLNIFTEQQRNEVKALICGSNPNKTSPLYQKINEMIAQSFEDVTLDERLIETEFRQTPKLGEVKVDYWLKPSFINTDNSLVFPENDEELNLKLIEYTDNKIIFSVMAEMSLEIRNEIYVLVSTKSDHLEKSLLNTEDVKHQKIMTHDVEFPKLKIKLIFEFKRVIEKSSPPNWRLTVSGKFKWRDSDVFDNNKSMEFIAESSVSQKFSPFLEMERHSAELPTSLRKRWLALKEQIEVWEDVSFYSREQYVSLMRNNRKICNFYFSKKKLGLRYRVDTKTMQITQLGGKSYLLWKISYRQ